MAIPKAPGETWCANITFQYNGDPVDVDVGIAAQLGETYRWTSKRITTQPSSKSGAVVWGAWNHGRIAVGNTVSAQAVIAPVDRLPGHDVETPKMDSRLVDVGAILETTTGSVYQVSLQPAPTQYGSFILYAVGFRPDAYAWYPIFFDTRTNQWKEDFVSWRSLTKPGMAVDIDKYNTQIIIYEASNSFNPNYVQYGPFTMAALYTGPYIFNVSIGGFLDLGAYHYDPVANVIHVGSYTFDL